jgi:chromosome segregation ATPase
MDQPGNHILLRGNQPGAADRMRELLARTVQDHVAEQWSNAGALEDIRQRMEGLEWLVKEVREREIPGMTDRLDGVTRHLDQTAQKPPQWAESLAEHIEVLRAQVAPVAELHSLWADVGTVSENVEHALPQLQLVCDTIGQAMEAMRAQDEQLTKLHENVSKLQQSMDSAAGRFSRLDKAVAELTQRTGQLDQEISAVKERAEVGFGALAAKVDGLAENVAGVGGQVDLLGGQVQVVHGRIERLDERLADTDDKLGALDTRLTSADDKLGALDTSLTSADGKIGSTDARVAALDTRLERLDERLDDQYDRVSAIEHILGAADTKLGALGSRLDAVGGQLTDQLEPLADELRSRPGHGDIQDALAKIVDAAQSDVTTQLGSLEETVLTLAEALLRPHGRQLPGPREGNRI